VPGHGVPGKVLTAGSVDAMWAVGVDATRGALASNAVEVPRLVPPR